MWLQECACWSAGEGEPVPGGALGAELESITGVLPSRAAGSWAALLPSRWMHSVDCA